MNYFDNAAAYLRTHHWARGTVRDHASGRVCAQGAFYYGNGSDGNGWINPGLHVAYRWLNRFVNARYHLLPEPMAAAPGMFGDIVPRWNDSFAAGEEQVIAMFEAASEAWELEQALALTAPPEASVACTFTPSVDLYLKDLYIKEFPALGAPMPFIEYADAAEAWLPKYMTFTKVDLVPVNA